MFYFLSKTAGLLTKPFSWLIILLLATLFVKNRRYKKILLIATVVTALVFSSPWCLNVCLCRWEPAPVHADSLQGVYDIGILLGGFSEYLPQYGRTQLIETGDRVWQTICLYRKGKIKKILITGGARKGIRPEAEAVRETLLLMGVPDSALLVEAASRNTYENMSNSNAMIRQIQPGARCLVITSALHIPRAMGCARKVGLVADAFPVEHITRYDKRLPTDWLTPKAEILWDWDRLSNEWAGMLAYKIRGYL
ncbi:MAG: YdcF family protein [Bacteroidales bacterium]|jgi:uncharacterized SAM-binding protein YcdF (DUF218 family)|nr:YdcF family protein [Bacteroidales bacterium]